MCLVTRHLRAQMTRDLHKLLIGGVKRLVNSGNLCFHSRGPFVLGSGQIQSLTTP